MWQGSRIRFWTVTSLFSSMPRVAGWCLLKKIKHATSLYLRMFENFFKKASETSETGLFSENSRFIDHSLLKGKFSKDALLEIYRKC